MNTIPKIYRLGDRFTQGIFDNEVSIQEKIDGSQFSFGVERRDDSRQLVCRSKSTEINQVEPGMFKAAVDKAIDLFAAGLLVEGLQYQCEYIAKPKHNVLAYERVPQGNLVLFDVRGAIYASQCDVRMWAEKLAILPVPELFVGKLTEFTAPEKIQELLNETTSVLGGQKIEGVVIKNYYADHKERPGHVLTAKVVSEQFKERQASKPRNPKKHGDELVGIINALRTEARWVKAVGALRDAGTLTDSPKDIGPLMKQLFVDLDSEEADWIKEQLFEAFRKQIVKGVSDGFPQWYLKLVESGGLSVYKQTLTEKEKDAEVEALGEHNCGM